MTVKTAALSTQDTADWKMSMKNYSKNITLIRIVVCIVFINKKVHFSAKTNSDNVLQILNKVPIPISMVEQISQKVLWTTNDQINYSISHICLNSHFIRYEIFQWSAIKHLQPP